MKHLQNKSEPKLNTMTVHANECDETAGFKVRELNGEIAVDGDEFVYKFNGHEKKRGEQIRFVGVHGAVTVEEHEGYTEAVAEVLRGRAHRTNVYDIDKISDDHIKVRFCDFASDDEKERITDERGVSRIDFVLEDEGGDDE